MAEVIEFLIFRLNYTATYLDKEVIWDTSRFDLVCCR